MITEIGIAAGEIWRLLDEGGEQRLSVLIKKLSSGEDLGLMALGWLCREGHIVFIKNDGITNIKLRDRNAH